MFQKRLSETRKKKGFTAQQMADYLCIHIRAYRKYESGDTMPNLNSLVKIADLLEVSTDYLLGRTENPLINM